VVLMFLKRSVVVRLSKTVGVREDLM